MILTWSMRRLKLHLEEALSDKYSPCTFPCLKTEWELAAFAALALKAMGDTG